MINFEETNTEETSIDFEVKKEETFEMPEEAANDLALMGSYANEGTVSNDYIEIKRDLLTTGKSQMLENIKQRDSSFRANSLVTAIKDTLSAPGLTLEQKDERLKAATELAGEDVARPIWRIYQESLVFNYDQDDKEYGDQQKQRWEDIETQETLESVLDDIRVDIVNLEKDTGSFMDRAGDIAEMTVPFSYSEAVRELYIHMVGKAPGSLIGDYLLPGENVHELKTIFHNLPTNEDKVEWAREMATFLKNTDSLIKDHNGFEAYILMNMLTDTGFDPDQDFDWDRLIDNVVGFLDLTAVGGMIAKGVKNPLKAMGIMNKTNPVLADRVIGAMAKSGDPEVLKQLDLSAEEIIRAGHFPSHSTEVLSGAPSDVIEAIKAVEEDMLGLLHRYAVENKTQGRKIRDIIEGYGGGKIHINKSGVKKHISDTEKVLSVTVGKSRTTGYATIRGAKQAAKLRGLDDQGIKIFKRSPTSDKLVKVKKDAKGNTKGEFFYQFTRKEEITPDNPFVDFTKTRAPLGSKSRYIYDIWSMFSRGDAKKLSGAEDLKHGIQAQIQKAGLAFDKLKVAEKENVLSYIVRGSEEGKTFTYDEAITGMAGVNPLSPKEFASYVNLRAVSDLVYSTENARLVDWLKNNNFKHLSGSDGIARYGKKLVSIKETKQVNEVIDGATGEVMTFTKEIRNGIKNGNGEIYQLRSGEHIRGNKYEYVYVDNKDLGKVKDIPNQALPYIDGYVHRSYSDKFFIERLNTNLSKNGGAKASKSEQTSVVGSAESQSEALELMRGMDGAEEGITYSVRMGREFVRNMGEGEAAFEFAGMNGLLHKGTRGPILNGLTDTKEGVVSAVDSIQSSMNKAASNLSIKPIIEKLEKDFVALYGEKLGMISRGNDNLFRFPMDKNRFNPPTTPADVKLHKQMLGNWEYINFLGRFEDPVSKGWKNTMFNIANMLDAKGYKSKTLNRMLDKVGNKDPLDILKSATFTGFLALNPVRQAFVQMSQHALLAPLDPKYIGTGRIYKDTSTLMYGAAIRNNKKLWGAQKGNLARVRGLSVEEYTKEIDMWMNSGLPSGIDSHNFLAGITFDSTELAGRTGVSKALAATGNVLKAPARFSRKVGFNFGEASNLAMSWHVARRRLGKGAKEEDIANEARGISFGMNRAGEVAYQRGYLKLTTQFFSMQHKAMLILMSGATGGKVGNRFFKQSEVAKMAGMQTLLFGAEGLGLYGLSSWLIDKYEDATGEEMGQETRQALVSGVISYGLNEALGTVGDNMGETRVNFSSFAPLSGSNLLGESVYDFLFNSNETGIMGLMGASGAYIVRANDHVKLAYEILQLPDPETGDTDNVLEAMKMLGSGFTSGINNYYKGSLAAREGFFRNKHQSPTVQATAIEGYAKMLFGLGTYDEKEYYRLRTDIDKMNRARKQQARITARALNEVYSNNQDLPANLLSSKLRGITSYVALLDEDERNILRPLIFEELIKMESSETGSGKLLNRLFSGDSQTLNSYKSQILGTMKDKKRQQALSEILDTLNDAPEKNIGYDEEKD